MSPPRNMRWSRSGRPKAIKSRKIIGGRNTSAFRPARVSRKRLEAPKVEDPVARILVSGKWSAATFRTSEGSGRRWTSSRMIRAPRLCFRKLSGFSIRRLVPGSSQSKYRTRSSDCASVVFPTRRTPRSQTTRFRDHASSIVSFHESRCCTPFGVAYSQTKRNIENTV